MIESPQSLALVRNALSIRYDLDAGDLDSRIAIVGASSEGQRLARIIKERGASLAAWVDDNYDVLNIESSYIEPFGAIASLDRSIPIVIASHRVLDAQKRARALGFTRVFPFAVLQILRPDIYPPHMFYEGILEDLLDNTEQYKWLMGELADERSRAVLFGAMHFRLTWDACAALEPIVERETLYHPHDEFGSSLFMFAPDEVYVDAGAFDGDSIRAFIKRTHGRYERIIAFEPDPMTCARLCESFGDERMEGRFDLYSSALYSQCADVPFQADGARGARCAIDGCAFVPAVALDNVLNGERVSFIKMNIEGSEREALMGAGETIARWLPKLAISVYHRPSDLWQIARDIREIDPHYSLFLRQHDGGIIETVLYALPRYS